MSCALLSFLAVGGFVGGLVRGVSGAIDVRARSSTDAQCNLLFPGDGGDVRDPAASKCAWKKGKLEQGGEYWWRETADGEPEISLTEPNNGWRVATLDGGSEYFWRETGNPDEPEVRLSKFMDEGPTGNAGGRSWRIGTLATGKRYLWRLPSGSDDPEVKMWSESRLDSGAPFWYDEDGEISLTDPFLDALPETP